MTEEKKKRFVWEKEENKTALTKGIRIFMALIFVACIVFAILAKNPEIRSYFIMSAVTSLLTIGLTFIPSFFNDNTPIIIPAALQTIFVVFIFLAEFFGEILRFYDRLPWWDVMLHTFSGVLLGILGVLVVYSLNRHNGVIQNMNQFSIIMFGFAFALAAGALWEIFESAGDQLFGMNMQRSVYVYSDKGTPEFEQEAIEYFNNNVRFFDNLGEGKKGRVFDIGLVDTMQDFYVDTLGALVAVVMTHVFLNKRRKESSRIASETQVE